MTNIINKYLFVSTVNAAELPRIINKPTAGKMDQQQGNDL